MIVLVKDYLACLVIDLIDLLRELFQLMRLKPFEKRDPRQALRFVTQLGWVSRHKCFLRWR